MSHFLLFLQCFVLFCYKKKIFCKNGNFKYHSTGTTGNSPKRIQPSPSLPSAAIKHLQLLITDITATSCPVQNEMEHSTYERTDCSPSKL
uniref:Putative secreted protein n=1 Tax=Anopheles darlingi TaxID=43151 RepID=A0A2M4DAM3_ANODA